MERCEPVTSSYSAGRERVEYLPTETNVCQSVKDDQPRAVMLG
jgi:hypothetical protein